MASLEWVLAVPLGDKALMGGKESGAKVSMKKLFSKQNVRKDGTFGKVPRRCSRPCGSMHWSTARCRACLSLAADVIIADGGAGVSCPQLSTLPPMEEIQGDPEQR